MVKITTALMLSAIFSAPAWAVNNGFFVAADYGGVHYSNAPHMQPSPGLCFFNCGENKFISSNIFSVSGGYHFNQNVGVEVSSTRIYDDSNEWSSSSGGFLIGPATSISTKETLSGSSIRAAAVGTYSLDAFDAPVDLIVKLGIAQNVLNYTITQTINSVSSYASITGRKTNLMYGVGVQRNYGEHVALRIQYENLGDIQIGSAGAAYNSKVGVSIYSLGCIFNF